MLLHTEKECLIWKKGYSNTRDMRSSKNREINVISNSGQFTLFVPTDLAFNDFLQKLGGIKEVRIVN